VTPARRYLFLMSARASRRTRGRARDAARALGGSVEIAALGGIDEARARLRQADSRVVPVVAGGDGTANLVARALRAEGMATRPMGVLPAGTGNAFAHSLGVGRMTAAVEVLRRGVPRALDVMVTNHPALPLALISISTGFEGRFLAEVAERRARGLPGFASVTLPGMLGGSYRGTTLICDGEAVLGPDQSFHSAGVYNLPCYFFGLRVMRGADPADGLGDARVYPDAASYWRTLLDPDGRLPAAVRGRRFHRARIESDGPVQADGEAGVGGAFEIGMEAGGVCVLAEST
jgi:diacylglycerol kinase family enzyme